MNTYIEQINSVGKTFIDFALPMFIQSSVLIIILLIIDFILRKRIRAVFRYWIWLIVLVKLILPPTLSLPTSPAYWFGDKIEKITESYPATEEADIYHFRDDLFTRPSFNSEPSEYKPEPAFNNEVPIASTPIMPKVSLSWQAEAFIIWLTLCLIMSILLIQRTFFVKRLINKSREANEKLINILERACLQMRVKKKIALRLSDTALSPSVCGLLKPTIMIPKALAQKINSNDFHAILLHELAHIKRYDLWINLVQAILQIIYIHNPLLWIANIVIRNVREQAVDEMVLVVMGEQAEDYPKTLLNISRFSFGSATLSLRLIGVAESKKALITRIKHITSRPFPKTVKLGVTGLIAIILAAFVLLPMAKAKKAVAAEAISSQSDENLDSEIDPGEQITFNGKIVESDGKPIEGAKITIYERYIGGGTTRSYILRQIGQALISNTEGKFVFKTKSKVWIMRSLERIGEFEQGLVVIQKDGFALNWAKWDVNSNIDINVTLTKSQSIEGIVMDETGKSITEAEVHAIVYKTKHSAADTSNWIAGFSPIEGLKTKTDKQGRFNINNIPANCLVDLFAKANNKAAISTYQRETGPAFKTGQKNIRIVLSDEGRIKGKFVDITTGKGIPNVKIFAKPHDLSSPVIEPPRFSSYFFEPLTDVSKQDGTFIIEGLCEGYYALLGDFPAKDKIFVEKGNDSNDVIIDCQGYVHGYVKDPDGNPVAGANVQFRPVPLPNLGSRTSGRFLLINSSTDEKGYYLNAHISGPYNVSAGYSKKNDDGNGYRSTSYQRQETFQGTQQVDLKFASFPEGTSNLVGYVKDQNNEILSDYIVQFSHSVANNPGQFDSGFSIKQIFYTTDGKFELKNLPEGKYTLTLNSIKTDGQYEFPMFQEVILKKDKTTENTFNIIKKQAYYGRVLFDDGTPVYFDPPPWPGLGSVGTVRIPAQIGDNSVTIDKDGYFEAFLKDEQYESIKSGEFDMQIYLPSLEMEHLIKSTGVSFPPEKLSTDKSQAGEVKIPKPSYNAEFDPSNAPSLIQKQLPGFEGIEINNDLKQSTNKKLLVCFFDFEQRPSRNLITQLSKKLQELEEKGISVITVNTSDAELKVLNDRLKEQNINLKVGKITADVEKIKFNWGVKSLPWLILTDKNHIVKFEGFQFSELNEKIEKAQKEIETNNTETVTSTESDTINQDSVGADLEANYSEVAEYITRNGQLGQLRYSETREVITKDELPILYKLLDDDEYAPYWHKVVKAIGLVSDDPESVNVLLKFLQRNDISKVDMHSLMGKPLALVMMGLIGGDKADSILKKGATPEGAQELAKDWIDEKPLPIPSDTTEKHAMINRIQQHSYLGLIFSGKPENIAFVEKIYNEQKKISISNHKNTELMTALIDTMATKEYIAKEGLESYLNLIDATDRIGAKEPYIEKYSFPLNEEDSAAKPKPVSSSASGVDVEALKKALFTHAPHLHCTLRTRSGQNSPQMQAIKELEVSGSEEAINVLLECLTSSKIDMKLKQNALTALGRIGTKPAIEATTKFESWSRSRYSNPQPFYMGALPSPIDHLISAPAIPLAKTIDSENKTWALVPLSYYGKLEFFLTSQTSGDTWSQPILLDISGLPELRIKSETEWNIKCQLSVKDDLVKIECNNRNYELKISDQIKDSDKDGLPDIVEAKLLTDPKNPDSDKDGIPDGKDSNPLTPRHKENNDTTEICQAVFSVMFATSNSQNAVAVVDRAEFAKQEYYGFAGPVIRVSQSRQGYVNLTSIKIKSESDDSATVSISDYVGSESASEHEVKLKKINDKWVVVEFVMTEIS